MGQIVSEGGIWCLEKSIITLEKTIMPKLEKTMRKSGESTGVSIYEL